MCLPISIFTKGRISGCHGVCRLLPHIGALIGLCAALVWNYKPFRKKRS